MVFECTTCHTVGQFSNQNKILKEIMMNLKFQCPGPCKQVFPFKEMNQHKKNNLCYSGYVRPADVEGPKKNLPKPIAQSQ